MVEQEHVNCSTPFPEVINFVDHSCSNNHENRKRNIYDSFEETLCQDSCVTNFGTCDHFYNGNTASFLDDYWHRMHDEKVSFVPDTYFEVTSPVSLWDSPLDLMETLKMDDVFQVDKDDLVQSPTLAELNLNNDESLFDSFNNFGTPYSSGHKIENKSLSLPSSNVHVIYKMPSLMGKSEVKSDSQFSAENEETPQLDISVEQNCISKNETKCTVKPQNLFEVSNSDFGVTSVHSQNNNPEMISIDVKQGPLTNECSIQDSEIKKTECSLKLASLDPETFDSEEDESEMECDYSSDGDDKSEETKQHSHKQPSGNQLLLQKKKSRYFWQYNIQSKGPKAPKIKLNGKSSAFADEYVGISDPVHDLKYFNKSFKNTVKSRRGDGNDLTPNPQKLYNIGLELEKLNSVIEDLVPANELPINARSKSRKEKNKLASRACRLKKKAQHEANKLKLFGLQLEQKQLIKVINEVKKMVRKGVENLQHKKVQGIHAKVEALCMQKYNTEVAGCTAEFVNKVLKNVETGCKDCWNAETWKKQLFYLQS